MADEMEDTQAQDTGLSIPPFGRARARLMHIFRVWAWAERKQENRDLRNEAAHVRWREDFENGIMRHPPVPQNRISWR